MKTFKNDKGYALLMVLMMIILFTVLGMALMATNMNSAKQFSLKENQVQARHQAEMGILHYNAILKDKISSLSNSAIKCSDIDALLGPTKKLSVGDYIIEPVKPSTTSCKEVENGKLLEIAINSKAIINENTIKEVKATFYAKNQGVSSISPSLGSGIPTKPNSPDTITINELNMKKENKQYEGSLIVNGKLDIEGGSSDNLMISKNLFIAGNIIIQNHACIASGGDFTALNSFDWGKSKTTLLVRRDALLPAFIGNWKKNQVNAYIFGDLYLPATYNYPVNKQDDRNLYVGGKVYQSKGKDVNGKDIYTQITNPFKKLQGSQVSVANNLPCAVPAAKEEMQGIPKWILQDDKIVNYQ